MFWGIGRWQHIGVVHDNALLLLAWVKAITAESASDSSRGSACMALECASEWSELFSRISVWHPGIQPLVANQLPRICHSYI